MEDAQASNPQGKNVLQKLLRLGEGRMVKRLKGVADYVNTLSDDVEKLSDAELRAKTDEFKKRVADGADLDDLLPEAFAVAREAAWRVLDQRHFDVQVMGGAALHFGNVDEVDSILIDEARTPLIISGPADGSSNWYTEFARLAPLMEKDTHYEV